MSDSTFSGGFSRRAALALIGGGALSCINSSASALPKPIMRTWPLGVQLWSVNAELHKDPAATLKQVKTTGYDVVETAGLAGLSGAGFRKLLDDNGLVCPSSHVAMGDLVSKLDEKIEEAHALGCQYLVCASPRPPAGFKMTGDWVSAIKQAMTLDAWKANADDLANIAPRVSRAGLKFAYHNHFMEFIDHGGVTGYDLITKAADPAHLRLEIDLGWVLVGGADPLKVLMAHADRVDMLHVKDFVRDPGQPLGFRSVDVGQGLIEWRPVLSAARRQGVAYLFVEQEAPYVRPVFESLATARAFLIKA